MLVDLRDLSDPDVQCRDRWSLVVGDRILDRFSCCRRGLLGGGGSCCCFRCLLFLVLLRRRFSNFLGDALAERFELLDAFREGDDAGLIGIDDAGFSGGQGQERELPGDVLSAHLTGQCQSDGMEQVLSLDTGLLRHGLHVGLIGLGEVALFVRPVDGVLEGLHRVFGVGEGERSGFKRTDYRLSESVKVPFLDHRPRLGVFDVREGCRKVVSQNGLGVQDGVLGRLHAFACQSGGGESHVDHFKITLRRSVLEDVLEFELVLDEFDQFFQRDHLHVLLIHPTEFLHIEDGGTLHDASQFKSIDELVAGENLVVRPVVPSEERQVVDHRIRQKSV
mmetsp:Transcript_23456/g.55533  ORF Transcript_23456/g.55533 Transcript_23456/m.55533 type:complete len:335 (+) Transcript_23456:665-1669(+)